nr:inhibitor of growth protein 2 isoform X2 [Chrysemys picta bellii]
MRRRLGGCGARLGGCGSGAGYWSQCGAGLGRADPARCLSPVTHRAWGRGDGQPRGEGGCARGKDGGLEKLRGRGKRPLSPLGLGRERAARGFSPPPGVGGDGRRLLYLSPPSGSCGSPRSWGWRSPSLCGGAGSDRPPLSGEALKEIDDVYEKYKTESDPIQKKRLQQHLQRALINSQELGDEKIQIVTQMLELVENRARQMETHSRCFQESDNEKPLEKAKVESCQPERSSRRPRRQRTSESRDLCHITNGIEDCDDQPPKEKRSKSAKKKKRSKAKQEREVSPVEFAIDPNEPTYCLCNQVSYGEMIGCDNEQCPIEWFHFSCVGLTYKPKGKWYCPKCRGDNEKTMDKCTDKSKKDRRSR